MEICIAIALFSITLPTSIMIMNTLKTQMLRARNQRVLIYKNVESIENSKANLYQNFDYYLPEIQESSPCMRKITFDSFSQYLSSEVQARRLGGDCDTGEDIENINQALASSTVKISNTNDVDEIKDFAFTVADLPDHLSVFDTRNRGLPGLMATTSLPGVSGSYPNALSVFYYDSKIYVGTHRTAGREFHIYNATNPNNILWLGSLELNHNINAISVRNNFAFLATSGNSKHLIILDISNPNNIFLKSSLALTGSEDAISIYQTGNNIFLGRKSGHLNPNIFLISVINPDFPIVSTSTIVSGNVIALRAVGKDLFAIASSTTEKKLYRLNRENLEILESIIIPNHHERF